MSYFPLFHDLEGCPVLIVGGGKVAMRRAVTLKAHGAKVRIVAPALTENTDDFDVQLRPFQTGDIDGMTLVIAATDDRAVNQTVGQVCRVAGIPVNVVDCDEECTFRFGAVAERGSVTVAVSTDGASPIAAKYLKQKIESAIPDNFDAVLDVMNEARALVKEAIPEQTARAELLRSVFERCLADEPLPDTETVRRMICDANRHD